MKKTLKNRFFYETTPEPSSGNGLRSYVVKTKTPSRKKARRPVKPQVKPKPFKPDLRQVPAPTAVGPITLHLDNSQCRITGLSSGVFKELQALLSYKEVTGRTIRTNSGRRIPEILTKHLLDRNGNYPSGLTYMVESFLSVRHIEPAFNDLRVLPTLGSAPLERRTAGRHTPYPEQVEGAKAVFKRGSGIVSAPTGFGKSVLMELIIDSFKVKSLVVVPSLQLKIQLTEGLQEAFGADKVGPLDAKGQPQFPISVENYQGLDPKVIPRGVDLLIIDEFHRSGASSYFDLNKTAWSKIYHKCGVSATPFRSRDEERILLESILSEVIYKVPYEVAVAKGYIVPMEAYIFRLPPVKGLDIRTWHGVYNKLVVKREDRNKLITDQAAKLIDGGCSTLILVKQVEHGRILQTMLHELGMEVPFVKGENDDNREVIAEFSSGRSKGLIATAGVFGEGIDSRACEYVLLALGGKARNAFSQQIGRGFRKFPGKESCKIFLYEDPSHKWLQAHHNLCVGYLKNDYGILPAFTPEGAKAPSRPPAAGSSR